MHIARLRGILGAILVCLSLAGGPARVEAQTADPVGLISSAAIQPFFSGGAVFTVFEVYSLGENPDLHSFFFTANCSRAFSIPFRMSAHDVTIVDTLDLGINFNGLMALAKSVDNITPIAMDSPITIRGHRVNLLQDTLWNVDPISAANAEDPTRIWNPLRSAAQTVTFADDPALGVTTAWWIVCPKNDVVVDLGGGIPPLPVGANLIRFRAYDLDEDPILDLQFNCQCLTEIRPNSLHTTLFKQPRLVEMVTYVGAPPASPPSFVGYRVIQFAVPGFNEDSFGRMSGMSAASLLTGVPVPLAR